MLFCFVTGIRTGLPAPGNGKPLMLCIPFESIRHDKIFTGHEYMPSMAVVAFNLYLGYDMSRFYDLQILVTT